MSIIVNSRNIFCLGWKSDKSLATQNKKDDLSDNDDNVRDNDNNFIVRSARRYIPPTDSTNKHGNTEYQCKSVKSVGTKTPTDSTNKHGYAEYQCR